MWMIALRRSASPSTEASWTVGLDRVSAARVRDLMRLLKVT